MTELTNVVTFLMTTVGTVVTTVTANPVLMVGIGVTVVGGAIGLFRSLV